MPQGFRLYQHPVLAAQQALKIQHANVPLQGSHAPTLADSLSQIPFPCGRIFHPRQHVVMRPTQFERHCLSHWKGQIEAAQVAQVADIKTLAEQFRKPGGFLCCAQLLRHLPRSSGLS
jgi:hypothetical protein